MENLIENITLDEERALYASKNLTLKKVRFDGAADGESALKESSNITAEGCYCNLRYPFWHVKTLKISESEMSENCRAAVWYSSDVSIEKSKLYGIKAVRECNNVRLSHCDIRSCEFGWFARRIAMEDCTAQSEYFLFHAEHCNLKGVTLQGKYSFQYVKNAVIEDCTLQTKDALWHAKNVLVKNCVVKGEYLGWYSKNVTFENCLIEGTQPLCYCKNLKLINCRMQNADLCFEKSEVNATLTTAVESIKNAYRGKITLPAVGEIICTDPNAKAKIIIK